MHLSVNLICMLVTCRETQSTKRTITTITADFAAPKQSCWRLKATKRPASTQRQQLSAARRRQKAAIELRRGDVAYRPPPWHLTYRTTAEELHTPDMIKVLDSQECTNSEVHVEIDIVPVGAGFFLNGVASAELPLQCDCCLATFQQPLQAPLKVWLDATLEANEMPEDPCQLPFPPEVQAVDLGPVINDAIMLALPSANLCGQSDCSIRFAEVGVSGQRTGWSAGPTEQHLNKQARPSHKFSGQFGALQKLRSKATNGL